MNAFKTWILGLEHSVEHILSDFYTAVDRLEKLAVQKLHLADTQDEIISKATEAKEAALKVANQAQDAAEKLKAVIN